MNFTIENADTLFGTNNTAFSTLGGTNPGAFDWGLPFFYGRNVYTAIENMSTPGRHRPLHRFETGAHRPSPSASRVLTASRRRANAGKYHRRQR